MPAKYPAGTRVRFREPLNDRDLGEEFVVLSEADRYYDLDPIRTGIPEALLQQVEGPDSDEVEGTDGYAEAV